MIDAELVVPEVLTASTHKQELGSMKDINVAAQLPQPDSPAPMHPPWQDQEVSSHGPTGLNRSAWQLNKSTTQANAGKPQARVHWSP